MKVDRKFLSLFSNVALVSVVVLFMYSMGLFSQEDSGSGKDDTLKQVTEGTAIRRSVDLSTPRRSVELHLSNLQRNNYHPEVAAKALAVKDPSSDEAKELAIKLIKIYDGNGFLVDIEEIPDDPQYIDSSNGKQQYIVFSKYPQIYLEKINKKWLYSKRTLENIDEIYAETFPIDLSGFEDALPDFWTQRFLGIKVWKYGALLITLILSLILYRIFEWIFGYFILKIVRNNKFEMVLNKYVKPISKPLSFLLIIILLLIILPVYDFPVKVNIYFSYALNIMIPVAVTIILYRLSDLFGDIIEKITLKTKTKVDDQFVPLIRKTIKVVVFVFGGFYFLETMDINITPLIAGASVGGLAVALAAQDTLKNFFGSVTIFSDKPFEIGDWINFNGMDATVEEVGIRSTRLRTFYNSQVSIPNGKLADMMIDNYGRREFRRYNTNIALTYDTPTHLIEAFVEGLKKIVHNHPKTRKDYYQIHFHTFGDSSLNVLFYIFFKTEDWTLELEARHEVNLEIIKLAETLGVRFAFPTNTLHIEEFPGTQSLSPVYDRNRIESLKKVNTFAEQRRIMAARELEEKREIFDGGEEK
jgi:MscS family membrane protein